MNNQEKEKSMNRPFDVETVMRQIKEQAKQLKINQDRLHYKTDYYYKSIRYLSQQNKIVLFGAGEFGQLLYQELLYNEIQTVVGVCDNNEKAIGSNFDKYKILRPQDAVAMFKDACFVITPIHYDNEILQQLVELGLPIKQIRLFNMKITGLE